jgi:hypothetical protein
MAVPNEPEPKTQTFMGNLNNRACALWEEAEPEVEVIDVDAFELGVAEESINEMRCDYLL